MAGTVTALVAQSQHRGRVDVHIDGDVLFSATRIVASELRVGQALTDEELAALRARDEEETGYEACLGFLAYRPRSEAELSRYLARRGIGTGAAERVLDRLRGMRLADDAAFAAYWVEGREAMHPRGQWALRGELRAKGVASAQIESAVASTDDAANAARAAEAAARRYAHCDRETYRRRMMGYLQRRGFGFVVAREATDRSWQALAGDEPSGD